MEKPDIKTVTISKIGRFWGTHVNGKLLAMVLYRRGAESIQELIKRLAGLPVESPASAQPDGSSKPTSSKKVKKPSKPKAAAKTRPTKKDGQEKQSGQKPTTEAAATK